MEQENGRPQRSKATLLSPFPPALVQRRDCTVAFNHSWKYWITQVSAMEVFQELVPPVLGLQPPCMTAGGNALEARVLEYNTCRWSSFGIHPYAFNHLWVNFFPYVFHSFTFKIKMIGWAPLMRGESVVLLIVISALWRSYHPDDVPKRKK